ncbi:MAG TPA: hypothetical protein VJR06_01270, partial [Nitrososphaerales archaeon]|nr:hypothetical protein [Nitrososphaerales archaeon]
APDGIAFAGDPLIAVSCYGSGGLGTTNFIDPNTDEPVGYVQTAHGPQMVIFDWLLGEFFVVQYDGYLQGYLASAFESTTTTAGSQGSTSSSSTQSSTSEITSLIPLPGEETTTSTVEINPQMQEPNIPAFPFQPLLLAVFTVALLATFFVIRRVTLKGTPETDSVTPTGR